jgi:hypothetical protein
MGYNEDGFTMDREALQDLTRDELEAELADVQAVSRGLAEYEALIEDVLDNMFDVQDWLDENGGRTFTAEVSITLSGSYEVSIDDLGVGAEDFDGVENEDDLIEALVDAVSKHVWVEDAESVLDSLNGGWGTEAVIEDVRQVDYTG